MLKFKDKLKPYEYREHYRYNVEIWYKCFYNKTYFLDYMESYDTFYELKYKRFFI